MQKDKPKIWFCEECRVAMEYHDGYYKCPICGAEAWPWGEAHYKQDEVRAELGVKMHGHWFCQRCRVPMIPITEEYCKCPSCTAEVWYGRLTPKDKTDTEDWRELMEGDEEEGSCLQGRAVHGSSKANARRYMKYWKKPTTESLFKQLFDD